MRTFPETWIWGWNCGFGERYLASVISTRFLPRCNVSYTLTSIRHWCFFSWRNICRSLLGFPTPKVLRLHPLTSTMIKRQCQGAQGRGNAQGLATATPTPITHLYPFWTLLRVSFYINPLLSACFVLRDQLLVHQVPGEERRRSTLSYKHGIFRYSFFSYRVMDLIRPCHLDCYCETVSIPTSISTLVFPIAKYLKSYLGYLEQYY